MNKQLVETLIQIISSLDKEERNFLENKLFFDKAEPSTQELGKLAQKSGAFDFLQDEPDIYSFSDGESI